MRQLSSANSNEKAGKYQEETPFHASDIHFLPFLPTSTTVNTTLLIPFPLPQALPPLLTPTCKKLRHSLAAFLRLTHAHRPQYVFSNPCQWGGEGGDAYRNALLVRVIALFVSPILYLHLSGAYTRQECLTLPLDYGAKRSRDTTTFLLISRTYSKVKGDNDSPSCGPRRGFSHVLCVGL